MSLFKGLYLTPLLVLTVACSQAVSVEYYNNLGNMQVNGRADEAVKRIQKSSDIYGKNGRLQYLMDLGIAMFLAGKYKKSNDVLDMADAFMDELYTRHVSAYAGSLFTSDLSIPFRGEPYEQAYINVIKAFNYLKTGNPNDALIEAKRAEKRIAFAVSQNRKLRLGDDPFIHFFAGILYQVNDQFNDALISYRKAIKGYLAQQNLTGLSVPSALPALAWVCASKVGDSDEIEALNEAFPGVQEQARAFIGHGLAVVVQLAGFAPVKGERIMEMTVGRGLVMVQDWDVRSGEEDKFRQVMSVGKSMYGRNITIAIPTLIQRGDSGEPLCIDVNGKQQCTQDADDIGARARACFQDEMPGIMAKTVARTLLKFVTSEAVGAAAAKASKKGWVGLLARLTTQAAFSASEHADTRIWGTLPNRVRLAVFPVPKEGLARTRDLPGLINCVPNKHCFIILRTR